MANIKSAKKRILVTETKAARNKAIKSGVKTAIKKVEAAVAANDKAAAEAALRMQLLLSQALVQRVSSTRTTQPEKYLV